MFKVKIISILTLIFLMAQSNSYSQEKLMVNLNKLPVKSVEDLGPHHGMFKLYKIKKTKFDNVIVVGFELGEETNVVLTVSDSNGKIIETLINDTLDAGIYNVNYKSLNKIDTGDFTFKLVVKGKSGIKKIFAVK
ncbi:MAG: hypothetical protein ABI462_01010 [Ignavibacteria bacterium]